MPSGSHNPNIHKVLTADGVVTTAGKAGILYSVNVYGDDDSVLADLVDGGTGGTVILSVASVAGAQGSQSWTSVDGIVFNTDIFCNVTKAATNARVTVEYKQIED